MPKLYNFSKQQAVFDIALAILEDYNATEWSFGGGTALSAVYLDHRMSFDIDIFSEDYNFINQIIEERFILAKQLGIEKASVQTSPGGATFILDDEDAKLKLDFVYREPVTSSPYQYVTVFDKSYIKVQTPEEIIAKKIKFREIVTIRDYVDFYFAEKYSNIFTKGLKYCFTHIDRYIDILDQFLEIKESTFAQELKYMDVDCVKTKKDVGETILSLLDFPDTFQIAYDNTNEIVAFLDFIESYRDGYIEQSGTYNIVTINSNKAASILGIKNRKLSFKDIYGIDINSISDAIVL